MECVGPVCSPKVNVVNGVYGQYLAQMLIDECRGSWMWNVNDEVVNLITNQSMDDLVMQRSLKTICSRVNVWVWYEWSTWMEWIVNESSRVMMPQLIVNVFATLELINASKFNNNQKQARALPVVYREYKKLRYCTNGRRAFTNELQTNYKPIMVEPVWFPKL